MWEPLAFLIMTMYPGPRATFANSTDSSLEPAGVQWITKKQDKSLTSTLSIYLLCYLKLCVRFLLTLHEDILII
jgi:hypothetical protein